MATTAYKHDAGGAEWACLLECARPVPDAQRLREQFKDAVRWPLFCDLAEEHSVLGLAARALLDVDPTTIPPEAGETFRSWQRSQALFTLLLTAEMFRLFDAFRNAGIEALVTKGPALSLRCYGDSGLRQYGDLDLVVREKDITRVTELMLALDYEAAVPLSAIRAKKIPGEYNFRQKSTQLLVEFHTERTFRYHPRPLPIENLFQRRASVPFDGRDIPVLSLEDELILISIHGAKHFWERLSYIADVVAFVSRQALDWTKVESAAAEVGAERMLDAALRLAQDVLGAALPEAIAKRIQSNAALPKLLGPIRRWLPAAGAAPPGLLSRAAFRVRMRGGGLAGLGYLLRLSFSPTEEDWTEGREDRRRLLDAVGRPFRLARKYGHGGKPE